MGSPTRLLDDAGNLKDSYDYDVHPEPVWVCRGNPMMLVDLDGMSSKGGGKENSEYFVIGMNSPGILSTHICLHAS